MLGDPAGAIAPFPLVAPMQTPPNFDAWRDSVLSTDNNATGALTFLWHVRALLTGNEDPNFLNGSFFFPLTGAPQAGSPPTLANGGGNYTRPTGTTGAWVGLLTPPSEPANTFTLVLDLETASPARTLPYSACPLRRRPVDAPGSERDLAADCQLHRHGPDPADGQRAADRRPRRWRLPAQRAPRDRDRFRFRGLRRRLRPRHPPRERAASRIRARHAGPGHRVSSRGEQSRADARRHRRLGAQGCGAEQRARATDHHRRPVHQGRSHRRHAGPGRSPDEGGRGRGSGAADRDFARIRRVAGSRDRERQAGHQPRVRPDRRREPPVLHRQAQRRDHHQPVSRYRRRRLHLRLREPAPEQRGGGRRHRRVADSRHAPDAGLQAGDDLHAVRRPSCGRDRRGQDPDPAHHRAARDRGAPHRRAGEVLRDRPRPGTGARTDRGRGLRAGAADSLRRRRGRAVPARPRPVDGHRRHQAGRLLRRRGQRRRHRLRRRRGRLGRGLFRAVGDRRVHAAARRQSVAVPVRVTGGAARRPALVLHHRCRRRIRLQPVAARSWA